MNPHHFFAANSLVGHISSNIDAERSAMATRPFHFNRNCILLGTSAVTHNLFHSAEDGVFCVLNMEYKRYETIKNCHCLLKWLHVDGLENA